MFLIAFELGILEPVAILMSSLNNKNIIHIKIFSKPDCELCVPFKKIVADVVSKRKWRELVELSHINIDENEEAFALYAEKIPVAEINEHLAFKYHITENGLEKYLNQISL